MNTIRKRRERRDKVKEMRTWGEGNAKERQKRGELSEREQRK